MLLPFQSDPSGDALAPLYLQQSVHHVPFPRKVLSILWCLIEINLPIITLGSAFFYNCPSFRSLSSVADVVNNATIIFSRAAHRITLRRRERVQFGKNFLKAEIIFVRRVSRCGFVDYCSLEMISVSLAWSGQARLWSCFKRVCRFTDVHWLL